jgi:predicted AAA+ superfamily ATPase
MTMDQDLKATLSRIAEALDRLAPPAPAGTDMAAAEAYVWHAAGHRLEAVPKVNRVELDLLQGIDRQKETLLENTRRFAKALPANNALLWGSRGSGKSSIVKAVHAHVNREMGGPPGPLAPLMISVGFSSLPVIFLMASTGQPFPWPMERNCEWRGTPSLFKRTAMPQKL